MEPCKSWDNTVSLSCNHHLCRRCFGDYLSKTHGEVGDYCRLCDKVTISTPFGEIQDYPIRESVSHMHCPYCRQLCVECQDPAEIEDVSTEEDARNRRRRSSDRSCPHEFLQGTSLRLALWLKKNLEPHVRQQIRNPQRGGLYWCGLSLSIWADIHV